MIILGDLPYFRGIGYCDPHHFGKNLAFRSVELRTKLIFVSNSIVTK